ncbi:hypothetical protein [Solibaculum mannosilyticum]|uniref:Twitching motility protein PilT n=1 Tax=Solibaculum mannosilyticum TaxID=2780922 RepID=A0A7I8D0J8_9FIRM|nr:hypothetical protein [Solibaculum mannosilyticum]MCO7137449.1 hypothetical protein [[Clostridium] leptum]BCI60300.1 hypothetical protein C12CBH8_09390 [Solibaculum mannosilyticum]CZT55038.1 hypothetical protein BN3661_00109 [Eubacteriaceae bacterium CHKCI005]
MIKLIVGKKGSGKTKALLELVNKALDQSKGHVVFIEKSAKLLYDISHKARLLDADSYDIHGFDSFYGFISGMCAGDYDITDIFIDGTLKIGGNDLEAFAQFNKKVAALAEKHEINIVFSVSADAADLKDIDASEIMNP